MKNSNELQNRMVITNRGTKGEGPAPCPTLVDQLKAAKHPSAAKLAKEPQADKPMDRAANPKDGE